MVEKVKSRPSTLAPFPTWEKFKTQGYDAYADDIVVWLNGEITWSASIDPMLDEMEVMVDGINDAVDTINDSVLAVAVDKTAASISKGKAEAAQIGAESAQAVVESLTIPTDPSTTYNKTTIDAKEAASISEDMRINNLMFNIFDTLKNHGHEYARRLSLPASKYLSLRAETSMVDGERRLIDWSKANRVVSMKSGKRIELTGTMRLPVSVEYTLGDELSDQDIHIGAAAGNGVVDHGNGTVTLTQAAGDTSVIYFTCSDVSVLNGILEFYVTALTGPDFVTARWFDGSENHFFTETIRLGLNRWDVGAKSGSNGVYLYFNAPATARTMTLTSSSTSFKEMTEVTNWIIVQRPSGITEQLTPEDIGLTTTHYFQDETVGSFFTNRNAVPVATMKGFDEDPELFAKVLEGSVTVEGVTTDTMAAVFGIGESSGALLLDSKAGYGDDTYSGVITGSVGLTDLTNGNWRFSDTDVGGLYISVFSTAPAQDTYIVWKFTATVNSGSLTLSRYQREGTTYDLPQGDHTIKNGLNHILLPSRADSQRITIYIKSVLQTYDVDIMDSEFLEVSASEIKGYIPSARENVDQEDGAQHARLKKDAAGMILGTPDDGWLGADGKVTALLDSATELSDSIGGTVGYTFLDEVELQDGTQELRLTRYYPDTDTSTLKVNRGATITTANMHPFTKIEWTDKTALTGAPDQLAGRGNVEIDELWDDARVDQELKRRGY